tara:strand:- start:55 stop:243 length:189 start_codon:yes stop_codon:yes gene_type:complete
MNCLKINFTGNFPANALGPFIDGWGKNFSNENKFFCEIALMPKKTSRLGKQTKTEHKDFNTF